MNSTRRRFVTAVSISGVAVLSGCTGDADPEVGSLQVGNESDLPQLVHVEPISYPDDVPDPDERLSVSVYVEPGDERYYGNFVEFAGSYEFLATLGNDDVRTRTIEIAFTERSDGTVSGAAIEFTVQPTGGLNWRLTDRDGELG